MAHFERAVEVASHRDGGVARQGDVGPHSDAEGDQRGDDGHQGPERVAVVELRSAVRHQHRNGQQPDGDDIQRQLVVVGQHKRGDDTGEQATQGAAGRDRQIIRGEAPGGWPHAGELAVTHHGGAEQQREVRGKLRDPTDGFAGVPGVDARDRGAGHDREPQPAAIPAVAFETQDERQEIDDHRGDP